MKPQWRVPNSDHPVLTFGYTLIDVRSLDGAQLLASDRIQDNLLAILTGLDARTGATRKILERIGPPGGTSAARRTSAILGNLRIRRLGQTINEEAHKGPILSDIMDHDLLGPAIRQGLEQGLREGKQEVLRRLLQKRFGQIPDWVESRLTALPAADLDDFSVRILDATGFQDLFAQKQ